MCGDAAVYVNPYDEHSIAKGINTILSNDVFRESLISKGRERAKGFRWKESAQLHLTLLRKELQAPSASLIPVNNLIAVHET